MNGQMVRRSIVMMIALVGAGCATVEVHRAALVQPPAPPMWSGKTRPTGFALGNSTVVWNNAPEQAEGSESGLYVSSTQFDGNLHFSLGPTGRISLWLPVSYGPSYGSFAAAPCLVERPDYGVFSAGIGIGFSKHVSQRWYMGTSIETQLAFIPSHIKTYQDGLLIDDDQDIDVMPVLRWSGALGIDFGWVRLFGALALRNHPTNVRVSIETYGYQEGKVRFGPIYGLAGLGAEFDLGGHVSILAQAYQPFPLYEHDLIYGPIVGLTIDFHASRI